MVVYNSTQATSHRSVHMRPKQTTIDCISLPKTSQTQEELLVKEANRCCWYCYGIAWEQCRRTVNFELNADLAFNNNNNKLSFWHPKKRLTF